MSINLALIGRNIAHSQSKKIYEKILRERINYYLLDYDQEQLIPSLDDIFLRHNLLGLSITAPYKKHYVNDVIFDDEEVKKLGVINCIRKIERGKFEAINTDLSAARVILEKYLDRYNEVIVLGAGSMALMFHSILSSVDVKFRQYSRSQVGEIKYLDLANAHSDCLVINCCSRGFVFEGRLTQGTTFWDMNYDYEPHAKIWTDKVIYCDGLELLKLQALHAVGFWGFHH